MSKSCLPNASSGAFQRAFCASDQIRTGDRARLASVPSSTERLLASRRNGCPDHSQRMLSAAVDDEGEVLEIACWSSVIETESPSHQADAQIAGQRAARRPGRRATTVRSYGVGFRCSGFPAIMTGLPATIGRRTGIKWCAGASARCNASISRIEATLSERPCRRPQYLQPPAPSPLPLDASDLPIRSGGAMAQRDQRGMTTVRALPYSD